MNNEITITTIDEVINQLGNHLGGWIFENGELVKDALVIDTRELLEEFKEFELPYDDAMELCNELVKKHDMFSDFCGFTFSGIATESDNTYNWGSPLSHDLNINEFEYNGTKYVAIMVHLGGDIRGNYSYYFILECEFEDLFNIEFYPSVDITDTMVADLRWYSDTYSVYDYNKNDDVGEYYEMELNDLIAHLKEDGVEV